MFKFKGITRTLLTLAALAPALPVIGQDTRADLQGQELIDSLRGGGYVLLMRDPQAEQTLPQARGLDNQEDRGGRDLGRLVEDGREQAMRVGEALSRHQIPLGEVLISPDDRIRETAEIMGLEDARTETRLDEEQGASDEAADWLRAQAGEAPRQGENDLYITHHTNILRAFPELAPRPEEAEVIVIDPDGGEDSEPAIVSRVPFQAWEELPG